MHAAPGALKRPAAALSTTKPPKPPPAPMGPQGDLLSSTAVQKVSISESKCGYRVFLDLTQPKKDTLFPWRDGDTLAARRVAWAAVLAKIDADRD